MGIFMVFLVDSTYKSTKVEMSFQLKLLHDLYPKEVFVIPLQMRVTKRKKKAQVTQRLSHSLLTCTAKIQFLGNSTVTF